MKQKTFSIILKFFPGLFLVMLGMLLSGCAGGGGTHGDPMAKDAVTVTASVTSLGAGESSIITATVKRADGTPATDRTVSFTFGANKSGGTLTIINELCDGDSKAKAIYTAGSTSAANDVQDTIQARLANDSSDAVIITRKAGGSATSQISLMSASRPTLNAGQNSIILVTVIDATGVPVIGETVTFSLPIKNSGTPVLSAVSAVTDGSGTATTIYTPGIASGSLSVEDVVQATLASGSSRVVSITRSGLTTTAKRISSLNPSQTTVGAGQSSIITANVTDGQGNSVSGETVTFSIPVANSGAPTLSVTSSITDGSGNAITIYIPGVAAPTTSVSDAIQATLSNGSMRAVMITRSGSATAGGPILSQLAASPTSVNIGQSSIITATVTDSQGNALGGQTVNFSIPVANSGSPTFSAASVVTDGSGKAITIYRPGTSSPTDSVDDAIQATISNGSSRAVTITRLRQTAAGNTMILSITPDNRPNPNDSRTITATVANPSGNPVSGITVTFTFEANASGATLKPIGGVATPGPVNVTTGANGQAVITYTAGATSAKTDIIGAVITGATAAITISVQ